MNSLLFLGGFSVQSKPSPDRPPSLTDPCCRHGHLMLYDDSDQSEVRHVISLSLYSVSIYGGGEEIPEGELYIRRNAICLSRRNNAVDKTLDMGQNAMPFYLFSENCSLKEDFYFALLKNLEKSDETITPPIPLRYEQKHILSLVQRLHSSEEHLQTNWVNGLLGRLFLAIYKTSDIEKFIRTRITKKIARVNKPNFLSNIVLQKVHVGEGVPSITNPRLKEMTVDGDFCAEADLTYDGNFRLVSWINNSPYYCIRVCLLRGLIGGGC